MEIKKNAIFVMSMPRLNPSEKAVPVAEPKAIAGFCMRFELDTKCARSFLVQYKCSTLQ